MDGVLFNKDKTELIKYPSGKTETEYIVPDSVKSIENSAFEGCSNLTSIEIPKSVTSIGTFAFIACSNLTSITILNPNCDIVDSQWTFATNAYLADDGRYHIFGIGGIKYYSGTFYGYDNSTIQAYAEKYDCKFESLGEAPEKEVSLGDIDGDGFIDSVDSTAILVEYAELSTTGNSTLTDEQKKVADINGDGLIDAVDATNIMQYYAYLSTNGTDSIEIFLKNLY